MEPRLRSGRLVGLAVPAALAHSTAFALVQLGIVVGYPYGPENAWWAVAATACYLPLHLHHVTWAVRGLRPPAGLWTLLALTVVVVAASPAVGSTWLPVYAFVAVSALMVLRWPWSLVAVAAVAAAQAPLAIALDSPLDAGASYYSFVVWSRGSALFVPIWLLGAVRQLEQARRSLAEDAVVRERLRIDGEVRGIVGTALAAVAARGRRATAGPDDLDVLAGEASALVDDSRQALATVRRLVNTYRRPSLAAEIETAASLLRAAGMETRVELPAEGLPDAADDDVRAALRSAVSARLQDGGAGTCVLRATNDGGRPRVDVQTSPAAGGRAPDDRLVNGAALAATAEPVSLPRWSPRRGKVFLVAFHLPYIASMPFVAIPRHDLGLAPAATVALLALAIGGLHLRHSLALARGVRPAGALWTWLAMLPLAYVPLWWFTWDWVTMQWFVAVSGLIVLPRLPGAIAAVGPTVGPAVIAAWYSQTVPGAGPSFGVAVTAYYFFVIAMGTVALYGAPWLVRVLGDLSRARTEQAELAVGRERLRVSRDLHDLLGQSLSAVSLKGDLALRLLPTDAAAARAEIEGLTEVARDALRDMRAVARDEHGVSLPAEIEAATTLLAAAGVRADVDVDGDGELAGLAGPTEPVLAWAVRESATNTLRHSAATTWRVAARRRQGTIELEIVNDGVARDGETGETDVRPGTAAGGGSGLAGLRQRAEALSGTLAAGPTADGCFRLRIEIPDATQ